MVKAEGLSANIIQDELLNAHSSLVKLLRCSFWLERATWNANPCSSPAAHLQWLDCLRLSDLTPFSDWVCEYLRIFLIPLSHVAFQLQHV